METRVLLLEDNPGDARLIVEMLREPDGDGFVVDRADHLSAAVEKLREQPADAVILDLNLPDSQGLETFSRIHSLFPQIPTVILTGLSNEDEGMQAVRAGAQDYLVKGAISGTALIRALRYGIERKRADAMRAQLAAIVESSEDAITGETPEGVITSWNAAASRLYGYSPEEAVGQPASMLVPLERSHDHDKALKAQRQDVPVAPLETVRVRKDGTRVDVAVTLSTVKDLQGRVIGFSSIARNIGARKRAEAEKTRLVTAIEQAAEAIMIVNRKGLIHFINPAFTAITGYSPAEVMGHNPRILKSGAQDPKFYQEMWATVLEGRIWHGEMINRRKDGTLYNEEMTIAPVRDPSGEITDFIAIKQDVTDRKRAEQEIRELNASLEQRVIARTSELASAVAALQGEIRERMLAEEALEQLHRETELILSSAGDGIFRLSAEGKCTFANPAACGMLGYAQEELIGQDLHRLIRHALPDGTPCKPEDCGIQAALKHGLASRSENQLAHRKDGAAIPVDEVTTPIEEHGEIVSAVQILRDVSERRAVEKMKDEFISVVSHELRTPLTAIRGALGLLAAGRLEGQPDRARRMLEMAARNTDRLTRLVGDILDGERLDAGKTPLALKPCAATDLMKQAADLMHALGESLGVSLCVEGEAFTLRADPDGILQTLSNLLSNAIKFSPPGSTVRLVSRQSDGCGEFRVIDRGAGIPEDKLESIFGRFQPVDATDARRRGGSGLGLFICRSIVRRHGGRIWAESTPGGGSTFVVTIPLEIHASSAANPEVPQGEHASERGERDQANPGRR